MNHGTTNSSQKIHTLLKIIKMKMQYVPDCNKTTEDIPIFIYSLELTVLTRIQTYLHCVEELFKDIQKDTQRDMQGDIQEIRYLMDDRCMKLTALLLSQFSSKTTVNYYRRRSLADILKRYQNKMFPDDIDDTFSSLFAINRFNSAYISCSKVASAICSLLEIRCEEKPHIFNTWYVDRDTNFSIWKSIDYPSLSAVVAFFEDIGIPVEKLHADVFQNIIEGKKSEFYHMLALQIYLLSRCKLSYQDLKTIFENIPHIKNNCTYTFEQTMITASIQWHVFQLFSDQKTMRSNSDCNNTLLDCSDIMNIFSIINEDKTHTDLKSFYYDEFSPKNLFIEYISKSGKPRYRKSAYITDLISLEYKIGYYILETLLTRQTSHHFTLNKVNSETNHRNEVQAELYPQSIEEFISTIKNKLSGYFPDLQSVLLDNDSTLSILIRKVINSKDFKIIFDLSLISNLHTIESAGTQTHREKDGLLHLHAIGLIGYCLLDKIHDGELPHLYLPHAIFLIDRYKSEVLTCIYSTSYDETLFNHICRIFEQQSTYYLNCRKKQRKSRLADKSMGICISAFLFFPKIEFLNYFEKFFRKFQLARQIADDILDYEYDCKIGKRNSLAQFPYSNSSTKITYNSICKAIHHIRELLDDAQKIIYREDIPRCMSALFERYIQEVDDSARKYLFELELFSFMRDMDNTNTSDHPPPIIAH